MYWKRQGSYEYLVRTSRDNRQTRLGARGADTEAIHAAFATRKRDTETRLATLQNHLREAERQNKALRVGRVPTQVIDVLNALDETGLAEHFVVVGTHALYAYETAASVRIMPQALATQDVDFLWGARKRIQFMASLNQLGGISVLSVLQRADKTFLRDPDDASVAVTDRGFRVEFLRRMAQGDDPHPMRFSEAEDDLWPIQANRADVLTNAPRFEQIVVSSTGRMARMRTIDPASFVRFKKWMAGLTSNRPADKRRRDAEQARIVQRMLDEGLLD